MVRTSLVVPLKRIADEREMTLSALTPARSEMISSVSPSLKYSSAESGLRLTNGSTTSPRLGVSRRTDRVDPVVREITGWVSVEMGQALSDAVKSTAVAGRSAGSVASTRSRALLKWGGSPGWLCASTGGGSVRQIGRASCREREWH